MYEQIAQVADGVMLDVVHVAQTPQGGVVERVGAEGIEVDPLEVDPARMALVGLEVQLRCPPFVAEAAADGRRHAPNGRRAR